MMETWKWHDAPSADFAVIGQPVNHSLSPPMQRAALRYLRLSADYIAVEVPVGEVAAALEALLNKGYRGINVTLPHKGEAFDWCRNRSEEAARLGVVNTINLTSGAGLNTDVGGFMDSLPPRRFERALVLGAGGAARSVIYALSLSKCDIQIFNRTPDRAHELIDELEVEARVVSEADPTGVDLIVNTTSASLSGQVPPVLWDRAEADCHAYDLAYSDRGTHFMHLAEAKGLSAQDGRLMLVMQGALSLEWWLGMRRREDVRNVMASAIGVERSLS